MSHYKLKPARTKMRKHWWVVYDDCVKVVAKFKQEEDCKLFYDMKYNNSYSPTFTKKNIKARVIEKAQ